MLAKYVAKVATELRSCPLGELDFWEGDGGLGQGDGG
jgi:hypothetical protein